MYVKIDWMRDERFPKSKRFRCQKGTKMLKHEWPLQELKQIKTAHSTQPAKVGGRSSGGIRGEWKMLYHDVQIVGELCGEYHGRPEMVNQANNKNVLGYQIMKELPSNSQPCLFVCLSCLRLQLLCRVVFAGWGCFRDDGFLSLGYNTAGSGSQSCGGRFDVIHGRVLFDPLYLDVLGE